MESIFACRMEPKNKNNKNKLGMCCYCDFIFGLIFVDMIYLPREKKKLRVDTL